MSENEVQALIAEIDEAITELEVTKAKMAIKIELGTKIRNYFMSCVDKTSKGSLIETLDKIEELTKHSHKVISIIDEVFE